MTNDPLSVILYLMNDIKKTYMKNSTNPALTNHIRSLSAYQEIMQERKEEKKRDREIMFETGFPCLVFGVVAGMIIAAMLMRIS